MINKLDPDLRVRLRSLRTRIESSELAPSGTEAVERIELIVVFTGELDDLAAIGFEPRTVMRNRQRGFTISTGSIPADRLEDLASIDHVLEVEGPHTYWPLLNYSLPEIRATAVHAGTPSRQGKDIVIGIIEQSFDWRHGAFVKPDGKTSRVLAIWDQVLKKEDGEKTGPGGLGVEYTQTQISDALKGIGKVRTLPGNEDVHGTHVAGIAAGNGRPATCCHGGGTYVGVAPQADLIVVRLKKSSELGTNQQLIDALNYIFNHREVAGKPVVVNISLGSNLGPHDGTMPVEMAIDTAVTEAPSRAIVVGGGNSARTTGDPGEVGETRSHVKGTVPGNKEVEVEFEIRGGDRGPAANMPAGSVVVGAEPLGPVLTGTVLDLWYDRAATVNLEVIAAGGASKTVNHGSDPPVVFVANLPAEGDLRCIVLITSTINGLFERDNNFRIRISSSSGNIPIGPWKLKLTNPNAGAVNFHCWIDRGRNAPTFLPADGPPDKVRASSDSTLTIPATAREAITVASYDARTDWSDCHPSGDITESSGRGPVARGAEKNKKPDIAAPGLLITSAKADAANLPGNCCDCCPDLCCFLYEDYSGTSMAAPHVAGAIALMLEEDPTLTKDQILKHLQASARPAPAGGTRETWGAGKLDVQAAVEKVRAAAAGGGAGGGPSMRLAIDREDWSRNLTPDFGSGSVAGDPGSARGTLADTSAGRPPLLAALRMLRARMEALADGQHIVAAVSRHFSEVRRLINTNRRVATIWHRAGGPRLLRRLLQGTIDADTLAPIASEPERQYFDRYCDLLARYGSPGLRASLARYRSTIVALLEAPLAAQGEPR